MPDSIIQGKYRYDDFTQIIPLKSTVEELLPSWSKGHRNAITKAQKVGIIVRITDSKNEWDLFYQMYLDSLKRWGSNASSKYRWDFFENIYNLRSPNRQLWLAYYQNQPVAGAIIFYAKKHVTYGYSAVLNNSLQYRPMNIIMYEVIKDACQKKYTWFDLCPSGGHQGVINFKKNFGSVEKQNTIIDTQPSWLKILTKIYKFYLVRFS
jgi:lipid II:glycine glycyltransferase (peptidoglycan interpeptide bridge formation enzyme)